MTVAFKKSTWSLHFIFCSRDEQLEHDALLYIPEEQQFLLKVVELAALHEVDVRQIYRTHGDGQAEVTYSDYDLINNLLHWCADNLLVREILVARNKGH